MEIVIATQNGHKVRELKAMLKGANAFDLLSLHNFPSYRPPEETGATCLENAELKARHAALALKKWVIADDSGLVVPILNGMPGVHSARFAGPNATDAENRAKLLKELAGKRDLERSAYYECCIALCSPDGTLKMLRGVCEGILSEVERGKNGFGYDPLFIKHDYMQTFAELEESVKNRISHRSKAVDKLLMALESL